MMRKKLKFTPPRPSTPKQSALEGWENEGGGISRVPSAQTKTSDRKPSQENRHAIHHPCPDGLQPARP
jgi:hypothetical protein